MASGVLTLAKLDFGDLAGGSAATGPPFDSIVGSGQKQMKYSVRCILLLPSNLTQFEISLLLRKGIH
jgi:hypothetical protein